MANSMFDWNYFGGDLFDIMGIEINWMQGSSFVPDSDELMLYRRTLSNQRPYCFLMDTNFDFMSNAVVDSYFQFALFYGLQRLTFQYNSHGFIRNLPKYVFCRCCHRHLLSKLDIGGSRPISFYQIHSPDKKFEHCRLATGDLCYFVCSKSSFCGEIWISISIYVYHSK